jgi:hypothetical protein
MKRVLLHFFIIIFFVVPNISNAKETIAFSVLDQEFELILPKGFCSATNAWWSEIRSAELELAKPAVPAGTFYPCNSNFENVIYSTDVHSHGWIMYFPEFIKCDQYCINDAMLKKLNVTGRFQDLMDSSKMFSTLRQEGITFKEPRATVANGKVFSMQMVKKIKNPVPGDLNYVTASNMVSRNDRIIYINMEFRTDKYSNAEMLNIIEEFVQMSENLVEN